MPPSPSQAAAVHSGIRLTLVFLLGTVIGIIITAVVGVLFLQSATGQTWLISQSVSHQQWPDLSTVAEQATGSSTVAAQLVNTPITVSIPSKYASQTYADALTATLRDMQALATSSNQLGQLLVQMNTRSLSGNFNGFFDLVVAAKSIETNQRAIVGQFGQHVQALAAANQSTPDAQTKITTQSLVEQAPVLSQDLNDYLAAVDKILSGSVPTAADIQALSDAANKFSTDSKTFSDALSQLTKRFTGQ